MNELDKPQKQYIPWVVVGLMDFVTVIGFDDIIYNFQNQGLVAFTSWIIMTFFYVIPYNLIVAHMGSTFSEHGGGITSWMRETNGLVLLDYRPALRRRCRQLCRHLIWLDRKWQWQHSSQPWQCLVWNSNRRHLRHLHLASAFLQK